MGFMSLFGGPFQLSPRVSLRVSCWVATGSKEAVPIAAHIRWRIGPGFATGFTKGFTTGFHGFYRCCDRYHAR